MYAIPLILCTIGSSASDLTVAETLRAAVEQWLTEVEFRSTYRLRAGFADSLEDALRGEINPKIRGGPAQQFEATGVFHKLGSNLRLSINFVGGPVFLSGETKVSEIAPAMTLTNTSFDEVSDGRVEVSYYPPTTFRPPKGTMGTVARVSKKQTKPSSFAAGTHTEMRINPLKPWPSPEKDPFGQLPVVGVETVDEEHVEVICQEKYQSGDEGHRRVLFWTKPSPPVVEKITEEYGPPDGRRDKSFALLSHFKECPGGLVARRVLWVFVSRSGSINSQEWRSDDLGNAPPSSEDFVITVAPTTKITGFRQAPPERTARRLEPSKIQLADLVDYQALGEARERERQARKKASNSRGSAMRTYMIWISGSLVLVLILVLFLRHRGG